MAPKPRGSGEWSRDQIRSGMAYFIGTGPKGTVCGNCEHFGADGGSWHSSARRCAKYQQLVGKPGARIEPSYRSCKYYEGKDV